MGWLFMEKPYNVRMFLDAEFTGGRLQSKQYRVIDSAIVNLKEYYAAIEIDSPTLERQVFGLVCLLEYRPKDPRGFTFGYKSMDECMGPNACKCPERLLKLFSAPQNGYATAWRQNCLRYHEDRKRIAKWPDGKRIRLPFNGREYVKVRSRHYRNVFRDMTSGCLTRLRQDTLFSAIEV